MAGVWNVNNAPNLSNKKLTSKLSFEIGQTFSARIVDADELKKMLTLRLPDGWQFPAMLEKSAEFTGQGLIKFQVVGYENGVIQLSIVETKDAESHQETDAVGNALLEDLNLDLSKEDLELLISMLKHNMPLSKENVSNVKVMMNLKNEVANSEEEKASFIQKYLNSKDIQFDSSEANEMKEVLNDFFDKLNSASEEDIMTLIENGIDITADNIKSFNNIVNGQGTIYKGLCEVKNEIVKEYNFESSNSSGLVKNDDILKLLSKIQTVDVDKIIDKNELKAEQTVKENVKEIVNDFFDKVEGKGNYENKEDQKFVSFIGMNEEDTTEDNGLFSLTEQAIKQRVVNNISIPINRLVSINLAILKDNVKAGQMDEDNIGKIVSEAEASIINETNSILQNELVELIDNSMGKMISDMLMGGVSPQNSTLTTLQDKRDAAEPLINKLQEDINTSVKNILDKMFSDTKEQIIKAQAQNQTENLREPAAVDSKAQADLVAQDTLPEKAENLKQFAKEVLQSLNSTYDGTKAAFRQEIADSIDDLLKDKLESIKSETKNVPVEKELEDFSKTIKTKLQEILVKQPSKELSSLKLGKIVEDVLKDKLANLNDAKNNSINVIKEQILSKTEEMKNTIKEFLQQKLELKPEIYSKVLDAIKSNINDFKVYNTLSNQYYLLDLPINYKEKEYECKIMIKDDRKKGKKIDSQNVKFVVTVNTTNIGTVDAFMEVKNNNFNINIKCEEQWVKLLDQRKEKLLADIKDMGYCVNIGFTQRKEPATIVSTREFFNDKTIGAIDTRA